MNSVSSWEMVKRGAIWVVALLVAVQVLGSEEKQFSKGVAYGKPVPLVVYKQDFKPSSLRVLPPATFRQGTKQAGATITVNYTGFTDEAKAAFQYAVDIWAAQITSSVTITINANWKSLGAGILGSCGASDYYRDFTGAPKSSTWYPVALAEAIAGQDLNSGAAEMDANFNSDLSIWYYGTDGNCPAGQYDLVTTILHEICHGLGFLGSFSYSGGTGSWGSGTGSPLAFDHFMYNGSSQSLLDTTLFPNSSTTLGAQLVSDDVYFVGTNAGTIELYAPSTWSQGSSLYHVAESYNGTDNALMTYSGSPGEAIHAPGTIVMNIFKDIGWTTDSSSGGTGDGTISLSKSTMSVEVNKGLDADSQTFTVSNTGSGSMDYTVSTDVTWMSCSPTSGTATKTATRQAFNRGYSYPGDMPMVTIRDTGISKKLYIPPKARKLSRQATATLNVTYTGFTAEQKTAYEYAKGIWEKTLTSSVTINVDAKWDSLGNGILGQAGPTDWKYDFTGAPQSSTYYPIALAEALAGTDLNTAGAADIQTWYNTQYADNFYYGTDGNCPAGKTDYVSVVLHELCHGLGFLGLCYAENGLGYYGGGTQYPSIWGRHMVDGSGNYMLDTYTSGTADLLTFFTGGSVWWKGTETGTIQLYAPSTWSGGSSISHVNTTYDGTADSLMTYSIDTGTAVHSFGTVMPNMMKDMGWTVDTSGGGGGDDPTDSNTITVSFDTDSLDAGTYTGTISVASNDASNSPQTIAVTLTVVGGAYNVTIGSVFEVDASLCTEAGITSFDKKPKVYASVSGKNKGVKVLTKGYPTSTIECEWKAKVDSGTYSLYVQPKAKGVKYSAEEVSDSFTVENPDLTSLVDNGTTITLTGKYFGTKKPKVYVTYEDAKGKIKKMRFKVTSISMTSSDGSSTLEAAKHKKLSTISSGILYIENKIGYDYTPITVSSLKGKGMVIKKMGK